MVSAPGKPSACQRNWDGRYENFWWYNRVRGRFCCEKGYVNLRFLIDIT